MGSKHIYFIIREERILSFFIIVEIELGKILCLLHTIFSVSHIKSIKDSKIVFLKCKPKYLSDITFSFSFRSRNKYQKCKAINLCWAGGCFSLSNRGSYVIHTEIEQIGWKEALER